MRDERVDAVVQQRNGRAQNWRQRQGDDLVTTYDGGLVGTEKHTVLWDQSHKHILGSTKTTKGEFKQLDGLCVNCSSGTTRLSINDTPRQQPPAVKDDNPVDIFWTHYYAEQRRRDKEKEEQEKAEEKTETEKPVSPEELNAHWTQRVRDPKFDVRTAEQLAERMRRGFREVSCTDVEACARVGTAKEKPEDFAACFQ